MTRKTPYKHPVKSHTRGGVPVKHYERGKGTPEKKQRNTSMRIGKGSEYNVVFIFGDSGRESYNVKSGTATGALSDAVARIQRGSVPYHARVRRLRG